MWLLFYSMFIYCNTMRTQSVRKRAAFPGPENRGENGKRADDRGEGMNGRGGCYCEASQSFASSRDGKAWRCLPLKRITLFRMICFRPVTPTTAAAAT